MTCRTPGRRFRAVLIVFSQPVQCISFTSIVVDLVMASPWLTRYINVIYLPVTVRFTEIIFLCCFEDDGIYRSRNGRY